MRQTKKQIRDARLATIKVELAALDADLMARKARGENITPLDLRPVMVLMGEKRRLTIAGFGK